MFGFGISFAYCKCYAISAKKKKPLSRFFLLYLLGDSGRVKRPRAFALFPDQSNPFISKCKGNFPDRRNQFRWGPYLFIYWETKNGIKTAYCNGYAKCHKTINLAIGFYPCQSLLICNPTSYRLRIDYVYVTRNTLVFSHQMG